MTLAASETVIARRSQVGPHLEFSKSWMMMDCSLRPDPRPSCVLRLHYTLCSSDLRRHHRSCLELDCSSSWWRLELLRGLKTVRSELLRRHCGPSFQSSVSLTSSAKRLWFAGASALLCLPLCRHYAAEFTDIVGVLRYE